MMSVCLHNKSVNMNTNKTATTQQVANVCMIISQGVLVIGECCGSYGSGSFDGGSRSIYFGMIVGAVIIILQKS